MKKKLAVVGSRNFNDYEKMEASLSDLVDKVSQVISGGAKGADLLAQKWADENNIPFVAILPDWKKNGRAAGPMRNREIIESCDFCIAFWDGKSRGTASSIRFCEKQGKRVTIVKF